MPNFNSNEFYGNSVFLLFFPGAPGTLRGGGAPHAISTWLRCIPLSILSARALAVTYWLLWLDFYILLPGKSIQDELGEKRLPEQCNKILNSDGWKED